MHIPGLLIEYLMTGGLVLLLIRICFPELAEGIRDEIDRPLLLALMIPVVYVTGVVVDSVTSKILQKPKEGLRASVRRDQQARGLVIPDQALDYDIHPYLWQHSSDLARQVALRSSKDRIVRGGMATLLVFVPLFWIQGQAAEAATALVVGVILVPVWAGAERRSYRYRLIAARVSEADRALRGPTVDPESEP